VSEETVDVQVPAGSPEEFQSDVELAIRNEFLPDELRQLRQRFERDGREAIRDAAEDYIGEETDNREAYVDAVADAFEAVLV
jgi:hypothetical protein